MFINPFISSSKFAPKFRESVICPSNFLRLKLMIKMYRVFVRVRRHRCWWCRWLIFFISFFRRFDATDLATPNVTSLLRYLFKFIHTKKVSTTGNYQMATNPKTFVRRIPLKLSTMASNRSLCTSLKQNKAEKFSLPTITKFASRQWHK